ncbi:MAG: methionine aminotransferase [Xanthomonadales bacterium]|nr:methionine aminotransferase [Xanthomonadales bacterium]
MAIPASKLPAVGTTIFTVMSRLAAEHGAINLGQGFPDFDPPPLLRAALARHVEAGRNQYAPMPGLPRLRMAIAELVARCQGWRPDPEEEVTVTSGASEAIADALLALVHPGDQVLLFDPAYDLYDPMVRLAGGEPVHLPLVAPAFAIDWERVEAAIGPRTRGVVVNSPHNPCGTLLGREDLDRLAGLAERHGLWVISDEVYEHIVFDGRRHLSALAHEGLRPRCVAVSSFGKTFHCTGWKLGYAVAPPALTRELRKVHQYNTFCSFTAAQEAVADALERDAGHVAGLAGFYQRLRDRFLGLLAGTRLRPLPVAGSYFVLADYGALSQAADREFCERLVREHGIAAVPLSPFYAEPPPGQRLIRLCFAKREDTLEAAAARLAAL